MKITVQALRRVIKEEISRILSENKDISPEQSRADYERYKESHQLQGIWTTLVKPLNLALQNKTNKTLKFEFTKPREPWVVLASGEAAGIDDLRRQVKDEKYKKYYAYEAFFNAIDKVLGNASAVSQSIRRYFDDENLTEDVVKKGFDDYQKLKDRFVRKDTSEMGEKVYGRESDEMIDNMTGKHVPGTASISSGGSLGGT